MEGDSPRIKKVYQLSLADDPSQIPTEDFERDGRLYYLLDMTRKDEVGVDIQTITQTKTLASETNNIRNLSAYVRKMALNGYVFHVDLAPVKDIVSLQRRCASNLNQIAVRANTSGGVYPDEIKALQKDYADLWGLLSELLERLSEVVAL